MKRLSLSTWLSVSCSHGSAAFSPAGGSVGAASVLSGYTRGQRVQANAWIVLLLRPCSRAILLIHMFRALCHKVLAGLQSTISKTVWMGL